MRFDALDSAIMNIGNDLLHEMYPQMSMAYETWPQLRRLQNEIGCAYVLAAILTVCIVCITASWDVVSSIVCGIWRFVFGVVSLCNEYMTTRLYMTWVDFYCRSNHNHRVSTLWKSQFAVRLPRDRFEPERYYDDYHYHMRCILHAIWLWPRTAFCVRWYSLISDQEILPWMVPRVITEWIPTPLLETLRGMPNKIPCHWE